MAEHRSDGEKKQSCWGIDGNLYNLMVIYGQQKSSPRDSNPRPTHYECVALPTELGKHRNYMIYLPVKQATQLFYYKAYENSRIFLS
ncbi:MAG: hypothetical protein H6Q59_2225 [Firmicutes bacterium]|nr:hypothetical protein [Bacillota bacterium]